MIDLLAFNFSHLQIKVIDIIEYSLGMFLRYSLLLLILFRCFIWIVLYPVLFQFLFEVHQVFFIFVAFVLINFQYLFLNFFLVYLWKLVFISMSFLYRNYYYSLMFHLCFFSLVIFRMLIPFYFNILNYIIYIYISFEYSKLLLIL